LGPQGPAKNVRPGKTNLSRMSVRVKEEKSFKPREGGFHEVRKHQYGRRRSAKQTPQSRNK